MKRYTAQSSQHGLQPWTLSLREALKTGSLKLCHEFWLAGAGIEIRRGNDAIWAMVYGPKSGFAFRLAYAPALDADVQVAVEGDPNTQAVRSPAPPSAPHLTVTLRVRSALGHYKIVVAAPDLQQPLLRWMTTLTPAADLRIPFWPRDVYPISVRGNPAATKGVVQASQRGTNTGLLYVTLDQPRFGSLLYVQNLTALNDYFRITQTQPDGCVDGEWPELGYQPPPMSHPLPKGKAVTLSDALIQWSNEIPTTAGQSGQRFLDLLAGIYQQLDRPEPEYHPWPKRAQDTLADLKRSRKASVKQWGHRYIRPYVQTKPPDSMIQLAVLWPLRAYESWLGQTLPFATALSRGLRRFYDPKIGTVRRYLPQVHLEDEDGNAREKGVAPEDAVDSWYLYHPLASLGRMAMEGYADARALFLDGIDFAIKIGRHFKYRWPVQFEIKSLRVITGERKPGAPGQTDVPGLYAFVMLQAFALTQNKRFLREAERAMDALIAEGERFDLMYQANITAWGAAASLWLSQVIAENAKPGESERQRTSRSQRYREQSYMFLASFFHNTALWQSKLGHAAHYPTFMGATCLHDAAYMAPYEEFESYIAFQEYLGRAQNQVPESVALLLAEYCKYVLSRAWYFYPDALPKSALASTNRNGRIDPRLNFPVEDLYRDGQPAGQVGQEVYGCGAAFKFAAFAYHRFDTAPFHLFCNYPVIDIKAPADLVNTASPPDLNCIEFQVGGARLSCQVRLIPLTRKGLPRVTATITPKQAAIPTQIGATPPTTSATVKSLVADAQGHLVFTVPADSVVKLKWSA